MSKTIISKIQNMSDEALEVERFWELVDLLEWLRPPFVREIEYTEHHYEEMQELLELLPEYEENPEPLEYEERKQDLVYFNKDRDVKSFLEAVRVEATNITWAFNCGECGGNTMEGECTCPERCMCDRVMDKDYCTECEYSPVREDEDEEHEELQQHEGKKQ